MESESPLVALRLLVAQLHVRTRKAAESAKVFPMHIAYKVIKAAIERGDLPPPPDGKWTEDMMDFKGVPVAGLVALQGVRPSAGLVSILSAYRLWKAINLRRRIRLGFEGERHVGEALNQLMLVGYRVFHDFLITDKPRSIRNIDHIVIGSNGVFALETKTRRKVKGENGE
jgi:hypothetical protein